MDYYPPGIPFAYDTKKAAQLLTQDGWKDSNNDGVLDKIIDGKKTDLAFTIIVCEPQTERWLSLFAEDAKKLGIRVSLQRMPDDGQLWTRMQTHKFEAVAATSLGIMVGRGYRSNSYYNFYGYNNPKIDALLDRLAPEFNIAKRKKIDRRMLEIIRKDHTKIPGLFTNKSFYIVAPDLKVSKKRPQNPTQWTQN
jgi:ABC-type transport system substrate-binding protein